MLSERPQISEETGSLRVTVGNNTTRLTARQPAQKPEGKRRRDPCMDEGLLGVGHGLVRTQAPMALALVYAVDSGLHSIIFTPPKKALKKKKMLNNQWFLFIE